jgi:RNA polymerase sigma factor (sigma-70 family)
MATAQLSEFLQHLRAVMLLTDDTRLTDAQLLSRFVDHRDEAAFEALVHRHARMVWGVCCRLLRLQDAEDAFQATFLVLVRRATCVFPREMVAKWLHGVAYQTALKTRATVAKRKRREMHLSELPEPKPAVTGRDVWDDLRPLIDHEVSRLPDKLRAVIVLCDLEDKSRREAAQQLQCPEGTVASRLVRARAMLRKRLSRHGLSVSGSVLAAVLSEQASASVPASVVSVTVKVTAMLSAGQVAATGAISADVLALAEGVIGAMVASKITFVMAVILLSGLVGFGTVPLLCGMQATEPPPALRGAGVELTPIAKAGMNQDSAKGQEKSPEPPPAEQLAAIKREMEAASKHYRTDMEQAKDKREQDFHTERWYRHGGLGLRRLVALAERFPNDPVAVDALSYILSSGNPLGYHSTTSNPVRRAYALLAERYAASDRLATACQMAYRYADYIPAAETFLRAVLVQNRSKEIQAYACLSLSWVTERYAQLNKLLHDQTRAKDLRDAYPAEAIRHAEAIDVERYARESDALLKRVVAEFADVKSPTGNQTLGEVARGKLFHRLMLVTGKEAPDIHADDIDGKPVKLSDYRGKVVMLHFWASWCGPCMAKVPYERALVKRLEGKPFVLLGVNGDENREAARRAIAKEKMSWRSFFDGESGRGPIAVKWGVASWPTVYVIDAKGVIRSTGDTDKKLDELVDALVAEVEKSKPARK